MSVSIALCQARQLQSQVALLLREDGGTWEAGGT